MAKFAKAYAYGDVLLVPKKSVLASRTDADLSTRLTKHIRLDAPIISANMDRVTESTMAIAVARLGGIGIIHRFNKPEEEAAEIALVKALNLPVGGAIGVRPEEIERAKRLVEAGVDVLVVDIAHGHAEAMGEMLELLAKNFPKIEVISGNIATPEAVAFLGQYPNLGAVKVGIGPGSTCSTRVVTGFGVPQISAVMECAAAADELDLPLIADGGIDSSGAIVKALAAGADSVMLGNLLAGTDEAPGAVIKHKGALVKEMRGMASREAREGRAQKVQERPDLDRVSAEGVAGFVPYKGSVTRVITELLGGIRSGISYGGATNIRQLQDNAEFREISSAGWHESKPHDLLFGDPLQ